MMKRDARLLSGERSLSDRASRALRKVGYVDSKHLLLPCSTSVRGRLDSKTAAVGADLHEHACRRDWEVHQPVQMYTKGNLGVCVRGAPAQLWQWLAAVVETCSVPCPTHAATHGRSRRPSRDLLRHAVRELAGRRKQWPVDRRCSKRQVQRRKAGHICTTARAGHVVKNCAVCACCTLACCI